MRQRLLTTDEFYQIAVGKLLELCTNSINKQRIVQLSGYLYLTVDNGDTFELIINDDEDVKLNDETIKNTNSEVFQSIALDCEEEVGDEAIQQNVANVVDSDEEVGDEAIQQNVANVVDSNAHFGDEYDVDAMKLTSAKSTLASETLIDATSQFVTNKVPCSRFNLHHIKRKYCFSSCRYSLQTIQSLHQRKFMNRGQNTRYSGAQKSSEVSSDTISSTREMRLGTNEHTTEERSMAVVNNTLVDNNSYQCALCGEIYVGIESSIRHEVNMHGREMSENTDRQWMLNSDVISSTADHINLPNSVKVDELLKPTGTSASPWKHNWQSDTNVQRRQQKENKLPLPVRYTREEPVVNDTVMDTVNDTVKVTVKDPANDTVVCESDKTDVNEYYDVPKIVRYKYICQMCGQTFQTAFGVRRHERNIHGRVVSIGRKVKRVLDNSVPSTAPSSSHRRKYLCQPCNKVFLTRWGLSRHNVTLHGKVLKNRRPDWYFVAARDTERCGSRAKLTPSEQQTEDEIQTTEVNNETEDLNIQQQSYVMSVKSQGSETSSYASREQTLSDSTIVKIDQSSLGKTNVAAQHEDQQQTLRYKFACQICGKLFAYAHGVRTHEMNVHGRVISVGKALKRVVDNSTSFVPLRKFECQPCKKIFKYKWSLIRHEVSLHGKVLKNHKRKWFPVAPWQSLPSDQSAFDSGKTEVGAYCGSREESTPVKHPTTIYLVPAGRYRYMRGDMPTKWGFSRNNAHQRMVVKIGGTSVNRLLGKGSSATSETANCEQSADQHSQTAECSNRKENRTDVSVASNAIEEQHQQQQTVRYKYVCQICGKQFAYAHGVRTHEMNVHGRVISVGKALKRVVDNSASFVPLRKFECQPCKKIFKYKSGLIRHEVSHHGKVLKNRKRKWFPVAPWQVSYPEKSALDARADEGKVISFEEAARSSDPVVKNRSMPVRYRYMRRSVSTKLGFFHNESDRRFGVKFGWTHGKRFSSTAKNTGEGGLSTDDSSDGQTNECTQTTKTTKTDTDSECYQLATQSSPMPNDLEDTGDATSCMKKCQKARSIHPSKRSSIGPFNCLDCEGSEFATYELVLAHRRDYHRRNDCHRCGSSFIGRLAFVEHARLVHPGIPIYKINMKFVCEFCSEIFVCERFLTDHIATVHHGVQHRCDHCGKMLGSALTLSIHIRDTHTLEKARTCDACGEQFPRLCSLIDHLHNTHPNLLPEKYRRRYDNKCDLCGMEFSRRATLLRHRETKHGDASIVHRCSLCGRTYICQRYLRRHQRNCAKRSKPQVSLNAEQSDVTDSNCFDFVNDI